MKINKLKESLDRWFKEKWTAQDGSECGSYKGRGRVKCRPASRVSSKTPQTWSEMSASEKKKAVRLKQKAHRSGKQFSSHKTGKTWSASKGKYRPGKQKGLKESIMEKWSMEYKKSINCNNPKGFSQRAHCQGKKKLKENYTSALSTFICEKWNPRNKKAHAACKASVKSRFKVWPSAYASAAVVRCYKKKVGSGD
jgi:hypothetical protein